MMIERGLWFKRWRILQEASRFMTRMGGSVIQGSSWITGLLIKTTMRMKSLFESPLISMIRFWSENVKCSEGICRSLSSSGFWRTSQSKMWRISWGTCGLFSLEILQSCSWFRIYMSSKLKPTKFLGSIYRKRLCLFRFRMKLICGIELLLLLLHRLNCIQLHYWYLDYHFGNSGDVSRVGTWFWLFFAIS